MQNQEPAEQFDDSHTQINYQMEQKLFLKSPKDYDFNKLKVSKQLALKLSPFVFDIDSRSREYFPSQLVHFFFENRRASFNTLLIFSSFFCIGSTFDWALRKKNLILHYTIKPSWRRRFLFFLLPSYLLSQFYYSYKINKNALLFKEVDMDEIDWDKVKVSLNRRLDEMEFK